MIPTLLLAFSAEAACPVSRTVDELRAALDARARALFATFVALLAQHRDMLARTFVDAFALLLLLGRGRLA